MKPIEHCETCQFCAKDSKQKVSCTEGVIKGEIKDPKDSSCSIHQVADRFKPKV